MSILNTNQITDLGGMEILIVMVVSDYSGSVIKNTLELLLEQYAKVQRDTMNCKYYKNILFLLEM